jgi:hypothetical protein
VLKSLGGESESTLPRNAGQYDALPHHLKGFAMANKKTTLRARRSQLTNQLALMSRDWGLYSALDWLPLERELYAITVKLRQDELVQYRYGRGK